MGTPQNLSFTTAYTACSPAHPQVTREPRTGSFPEYSQRSESPLAAVRPAQRVRTPGRVELYACRALLVTLSIALVLLVDFNSWYGGEPAAVIGATVITGAWFIAFGWLSRVTR